jgi:hypothetical protein
MSTEVNEAAVMDVSEPPMPTEAREVAVATGEGGVRAWGDETMTLKMSIGEEPVLASRAAGDPEVTDQATTVHTIQRHDTIIRERWIFRQGERGKPTVWACKSKGREGSVFLELLTKSGH